MYRMSWLSGVLLWVGSGASASALSPSSVRASSEYPPEGGVSYEARRAMDGKVSTAWVEGEQGSGLGSWLEVDLGEEKEIHQLRVWAGLWYSREYWHRANRPREIEVRWSDGTSRNFTLDDEMKVQVLTLPAPVRSDSIRVRIKQVYSGNTWLDTAISEIQVLDGDPGSRAHTRKVTASSQLPDDADGGYATFNLQDGLSDSMWCEGNKGGDGTGEWLDFQLEEGREIGGLHLINGIGTALPYWMKGNRASVATLTFSDGSTESVKLRNTMLPQDVAFTPHLTSSIKITFTEVVKGKEIDDLCISELWFR